jgi:RHS repeat-associated protein
MSLSSKGLDFIKKREGGFHSHVYDASGKRHLGDWTIGYGHSISNPKRDLATGNDDFGARYYRSVLGRWLSADWSSVPAPVPYANLTNPQTLNLYAMVSDNPETF